MKVIIVVLLCRAFVVVHGTPLTGAWLNVVNYYKGDV